MMFLPATRTKTVALAIVTLCILTLVLVARQTLFAQTQPTYTLVWTAPGDDGNSGTAYKYELRYSTDRPDTTNFDRWWSRATVYGNMPSPQVAGTPQSVNVPVGIISGTMQYHFVIRTVDEAGNISRYSNIATLFNPDSLPPDSVTNLRKL